MSNQATNGSSKTVLEMDDGETYLFTSESVREDIQTKCVIKYQVIRTQK